LPPRIDLAYRAFLGTRGFLIGDAVYRLEHSGSQYRISTVGEARGLAALLFPGEARAKSEGAITADGLQPTSYSVERTSGNRREAASFDWESGMVQLNGDQSAPLELPTFDPLVVLWQFYFAPPAQDQIEFNIATTRRIYHVTFRRIGAEKSRCPSARSTPKSEEGRRRQHRRSADMARVAALCRGQAPAVQRARDRRRLARQHPRRRHRRAAMTVRGSQLGALTDALAAVLPFKEPADSVLRGFFRHHRGLGQDDRAFIAEGVFAALRRLASLRAQAGSGSPRRLAIAVTLRELGASLREIEGALSTAETAWAKEFKAAKPVLSPAEAAELPSGSGTS
jgi:hypothetical protein